MDGVMGYIKAGFGFRRRRVQRSGSSTWHALSNFGPGNSLTYELRIKDDPFDRRVTFNIDGYRMILHGFQESALNPVTGSGFIVGNAGNRKVEPVWK